MTERELALRITANAEDAKSEIAELQKAEQGLVTSTDKATAAGIQQTGALQGTAVAQSQATSATQGLAAATTVSTVQADAHVVAFRSQSAATAAVVAALTEARAAMIALGTAGAVGSTQFTAALGRATIAVAGLEAEIVGARLAGGIVTPAQIAGLETYKARLGETVIGLGATSGATAGLAGNSRLLSTATTQAANAMVGKTVQVGALGGAMLRLVTGPIGLFITAVTLLPSLIKIVVDSVSNWSTKIGETIAGLNQQDGVQRKANESTEAYTARANAATDAEARRHVATLAAMEGTIGWTRSEEKLTAALELHQAAARGALEPTEKLERAAKALGFTLPAAFSPDTGASVKAFLEIYNAKLKESEDSARSFANVNKGAIEDWIKSYQSAHEHIPPALVDIAAKVGATNEKWKETEAALEAQIHHLRAYWEEANKVSEAFTNMGHAIEQTASQTFSFATGMEISNSKMEAQRASTNDLIDALNSLAKGLYGVDEASERAFDDGGEGEEIAQ